MKLAKRLLTAMLALSLVLSMAGCAASNDKEGSETSESSLTPSVDVKTDGTETVGGTGTTTELDNILKVAPSKVEMEDGFRLVVYLDVENISKSENLVVDWVNVSLDGVALGDRSIQEANDGKTDVSGWSPDTWTSHVKAGEKCTQIIYIVYPPDKCDEIEIDMSVTNKKQSTSEAASVTVSLADFDISNAHSTSPEQSESKSTISIEEQEVYNNNGVRVTVPEQELYKVLPSTVIENNMVDFTIECDWKYGAGLAVREVYINGKLVNEEDRDPNANQFGNNEPYQFGAYLGENGVQMLLESGSEANEVSINIFVEDPWKERSEEITVVIPVVVTEVK